MLSQRRHFSSAAGFILTDARGAELTDLDLFVRAASDFFCRSTTARRT